MINNIDTPKELLSSIEVTKILEESIDILGLETACTMVEPSYVLSIAGLKGENYVYSIPFQKDTPERITKFNSRFADRGLQFDVQIPNSWKEKGIENMGSGTFACLRGYVYKSRHSQLLAKIGVPPLTQSQGLTALEQWSEQCNKKLEEARKARLLPKEANIEIIQEGLTLGYPDQAVLDFEEAYRTGTTDELLDGWLTTIHPAAQRYQGASPDFMYASNSAADREIVEYLKNGKRILEEFYNSNWFTQLEKGDEFQKAYKASEEAHQNLINKLRSKERTSGG